MNTKQHWPQNIVSFVEEHAKTSYDKLVIQKLKGDASERQYWRIKHLGSTWILLQTLPFKADSDPFINIQSHLIKHKVCVPQIYAVSESAGVILLEDFGDNLLDVIVEKTSIKQAAKYYFLAIDELFKIHFDASKNDANCMAFNLFFDTKKLVSELEFMKENLLIRHLKVSLSPKEQTLISKAFHTICAQLDKQPKYFSHRDYHSKNLLLQKGKICVLDFQDARMGPCHYDLASLLRDSYVKLPEEMIKELLKYYLAEKNRREKSSLSLPDFEKIFDWMSIQRNLKAMGTFAYLNIEKNKPGYLKFIPHTWNNAQQNLEKFKELHPLLQLLQSKIGDSLI